MRNFTRVAILLVAIITGSFQIVWAQSALNPNDPIITYDPSKPPVQPAYGQIGKWVRTVKVEWNTDSYKAYIYKGVPFRIKFPKSYNPTVNDGKKYPMLVFWHGLGETGLDIYDNEFHLYHGGQIFRDAVDNGTFDGYIIAMQTQKANSGYFSIGHYQFMKEIIDYMVANNKLDPFRVVDNGLSAGGTAAFDMFLSYPTYIAASVAMSPVGNYGTPDIVAKSKFTPLWYVHGDQDNNPSPAQADAIKAAMDAAGANFRRTTLAGIDHLTWYPTWGDADFWPFLNRAYAANPWPLFGKTNFNPGEAINVTLGLVAGLDKYEWRKDGVPIAGANSNTLQVTQPGVYDARVTRGSSLSEWSKVPVRIIVGSDTPPPPPPPPAGTRIEAENYSAMSGITTEATADVDGVKDVTSLNNGDWMEYLVNAPSAGTYTLSLRVASATLGAHLMIGRIDGTILASLNIPNTGGLQKWTTITSNITLAAGQQTIRVASTENPTWNFNWMEFSFGGTASANQPPTVNAGPAQTITLPTNSVTLKGTASDADGSIVSYSWSQIAGPNAPSFSSSSSLSTTISNLIQGSYTFRLTVKDNGGATASSDVQISVNPAAVPGSTTRIEAESYVAMSGISREPTADVDGNLDVTSINNGDWMEYRVNAPTAGTYTVNLRIATPNVRPHIMIGRIDGTILASLDLPTTGGYQTWQTVTTTITLAAGLQTIRVASTETPSWNFNWLELVAPVAGVTVQSRDIQERIQLGKAIQVFPNPVQNRALLQVTHLFAGPLKVQLMRMDGTVAKEFSLVKPAGAFQSYLPLDGLPTGTYFMRLTMKDWSDTRKIIKQ